MWLQKNDRTSRQPSKKKLNKALAELIKTMTYRKTRGNVEMKYPTVGEEVWDSKQQKRVKETKTPKRTMALEKALAELKKLQGGFGEESAAARRSNSYTEYKKIPKTGKAPFKGGNQGTWNTYNYPNRTDDARLVPSSESTSWEANHPHERERIQRQGTKKLPKGGKSPKDLGKALAELKKLHISGGLGSRGLGTDHGHTQGSGDSTQVTLVQPRPEDDRVSSKRTTKEPKE